MCMRAYVWVSSRMEERGEASKRVKQKYID